MKQLAIEKYLRKKDIKEGMEVSLSGDKKAGKAVMKVSGGYTVNKNINIERVDEITVSYKDDVLTVELFISARAFHQILKEALREILSKSIKKHHFELPGGIKLSSLHSHFEPLTLIEAAKEIGRDYADNYINIRDNEYNGFEISKEDKEVIVSFYVKSFDDLDRQEKLEQNQEVRRRIGDYLYKQWGILNNGDDMALSNELHVLVKDEWEYERLIYVLSQVLIHLNEFADGKITLNNLCDYEMYRPLNFPGMTVRKLKNKGAVVLLTNSDREKLYKYIENKDTILHSQYVKVSKNYERIYFGIGFFEHEVTVQDFLNTLKMFARNFRKGGEQ